MKLPKIHIRGQIIVLLIFAVVLVLVRAMLFKSVDFLYLPWNLFLGLSPFLISGLLLWYHKNYKIIPVLLVVGIIVWLFLFPNAPYLVTDIVHLNHTRALSFWYDTILLFTCAWAGMLMAVSSLSHIEEIVRAYYTKRVAQVLLTFMILLSSFGMYLGRFLRWNSWDILVNPSYILTTIWDIFTHPYFYSTAYIFTGIFFVFITVSYFAWKGDRVV